MSTWILLRGLTRASGHWADFPARLEQRFPGSRIVALDLPGNGSLNMQRSPIRIAAMSDWCRDHLRARGLAPPYHLLAMSMGAMVALDWAARAPHTLSGAVLINTSLRGIDPWYQRLRPSSHAALLRIALGTGRADVKEAEILRLTSCRPAAAAAVLADWVRLREAQPVSASNALRQLLAAARYCAPSRAPAVPLLVLAGGGDRLVDPRCSQRLAQRWQADFALHPTAGHDLTLDDGDWVTGQIGQWLRRREPAGG